MRKNYLPARPPSSFKQGITLILIFSFLGYSVLLGHSSAFKATSNVNNPAGAHVPQGRKKQEKGKCTHCAPPGNQEIYIPLIDLREAQGSEIVFNSRSPKEIAVTPTFYKRDGTIITGGPVRVQSAEIRYVNLASLIPKRFRGERDWGGLSLSYYGGNREMWAQLRFLGVNGGSNVDEFFVVKDEQRADIQEAAWWMPEKSTAIIALGNITGTPTSATVDFGDGDSQTVSLAPHGTEIIRHKRDKEAGTESVAINITGMPGSIIPTGVIASKDGSFNSVIRFYDTKRAKQPNLFANGLRLANVTPHMVLKNTGDSPITAQPKFIALEGVAAADPVALPDVSLSPGETTEVNLTPLLQAVRNRHELDVVSVQVANNGEPGSLIGSLYGINNRSGVNYDTPLRDSGPVRTMTGSYPWKISDDFTTVVYITNISDQQAKFVTQLNYEGGKFIGNPGELKPGETAVFDLQKIRDQQMKDNAGHTLPKEISLGQFTWTVHGVTNGKLLLIGRAEMVSRSQHISTSYSCNNPCPPYEAITVDGFSTGLFDVGETYSNLTAWETYQYDTGFTLGPYAAHVTWSVDNPIATFDVTDYGHVAAMSCTDIGYANMTAFFTTEELYAWDGLECIDQQTTYNSEDVEPMEVDPTVHIEFTGSGIPLKNGTPPANTWPSYVNSVTMHANADFTGGTYQWSTTSNKVSLSNATSDTVTVTSVSKSDAANDVPIKVTFTVGDLTPATDQITTTVQQPTSLGFVSATSATANSCASGKTGLQKDITWQLQDQFGHAISFAIPGMDTLVANTGQNGCALSPLIGTPATEKAYTSSTGIWIHHYDFCTGNCACTTNGVQSYTFNGFSGIDLNFSFSCSGITVAGH